jgi:tetratricopeptide (TPR) repeat protein
MALAIDCLGIPHSPGFPLYVLAARAFRVFGIMSGARAGAVLAAVSVAGAAALLSWFIARTFGMWMGLAAGITLGFSPVAWSEACRAEVYGLHLFLTTLLMLVTRGRSTPRRAFVYGYVQILGVLTHPSAWAFIPLSWRFFNSRRNFATALVGAALAATMLLYLPIRSSRAPFLDWGNSDTLEGFAWLITLQEFAGDFSSGVLIPGGSLENAIQAVGHFLGDALPPLVLGLAAVGLPVLIGRWAALSVSMLILVVLTCAGGGGPDTAGYLLPLIPIAILSAVTALSLLKIPKPPVAAAWSVAFILLVLPEYRTLDRSGDDSAASYQTALAGNTRGRVLFTDNTIDWFLLLEHAFRSQYIPRVVYTPYLHLPWYRATLDTALMRYLPARRDPPQLLVEQVTRDMGIRPVYSFSSLPHGALGRLNPVGWLFRTEPFNEIEDRADLGRWRGECPFDSPGSYHRAVRLAQGGQLLVAQGWFRAAAERLRAALVCDPMNAGIWTSLADAEAHAKHFQSALKSTEIALSLAPGDEAIMQKSTRVIAELAEEGLGPEAAATLCSLSSANPRSIELAREAIRASLLAEQPQYGLKCLAAYAGPETAELANLEGTLYFVLRRFIDAELCFRRALDLAYTEHTLQARIAGNLALCLHQQGKLEEVKRVVDKWGLVPGELDDDPSH